MNNIKLIKNGNIFNSKMQTIVNPVNCKGVMGAGLAKKFKEKFPEMYQDYVKFCKESKLKIGKPVLWKQENKGKWILLFPTKYDWRKPSKIKWIEMGLEEFQKNYRNWGIVSIAVPALGCSLGGLSWIEVKPLMEKYLSNIDIPVELYIPKMEPIEIILDSFLEFLKMQYEKEIVKIAIINSLFPKPSGITDWKKRDNIDILLAIRKEIDNNFWEQLRKNIKLKKIINIFPQLKSVMKENYIYNINFSILE